MKMSDGQCGASTLCFEVMKALPAGIVALVVGIGAGLIAWQQVVIARNKLKLDLFERRYVVFLAVVDFCKSAVNDGPGAAQVMAFAQHHAALAFLFGDDVDGYWQEVGDRHRELWKINLRLSEHDLNVDPQPLAVARLEQETWFAAQVIGGTKAVFLKYLSFRNWR
jgi:hypothetical protein